MFGKLPNFGRLDSKDHRAQLRLNGYDPDEVFEGYSERFGVETREVTRKEHGGMLRGASYGIASSAMLRSNRQNRMSCDVCGEEIERTLKPGRTAEFVETRRAVRFFGITLTESVVDVECRCPRHRTH